MRHIRWAILGTGAAARSFAEDLRTIPHTELIAIGSRSAANARTFATKLGVPRPYGSLEEAVQDPDVDVRSGVWPHARRADLDRHSLGRQ